MRLDLGEREIEVIVDLLTQLPYRQSAPLIGKITQQLNDQGLQKEVGNLKDLVSELQTKLAASQAQPPA